ncbi:NUDIX domain-containing protein [Rhodococcus sp. NPDC003318]|uniref:NUDIX hydrolase n=1 Tax=Rhodococcus sp. NPDC003318 TaxID=3364503 RepID=UPI0036A066C6
MTFSATTVLVVALVVAVVVAIGVWAYGTANRLDRLHVRSDQSWQSLDAALARRAVVARAVSAAMVPSGAVFGSAAHPAADGTRLAALADRAERADRADRESAENLLSAALNAVPAEALAPQLVAELADAEARVLIARRFHNDAVRDTLALRTRRLVRLLHLGGTAPLPTYFEIAERTTPSAGAGQGVDEMRTSARVVLVDEQGRVLLLRGHDPQVPDVSFWFTIGGGVESGETLREAAVREIREETGLVVDGAVLRGPIWRRVAVFPYDGELIRSEELFFALAHPAFTPERFGFTELERRAISGHRWCSPADMRAVAADGETVYPEDLPDLVGEVRALLARDDEPGVRSIR